MSSPHVTKCEMDSGRKSGYYAAILSGKNDRGVKSSLQAPFLPAQEVILRLHPECIRSQQDLTLTEANKLTWMPH